MIKALALLSLFLMIAAIEAPGLVQRRSWRELAVFTGILLVAMAMAFAAMMDIRLLNPTPVINAIFGPVGKLMDKLLS